MEEALFAGCSAEAGAENQVHRCALAMCCMCRVVDSHCSPHSAGLAVSAGMVLQERIRKAVHTMEWERHMWLFVAASNSSALEAWNLLSMELGSPSVHA